uniref:Signal recognition particle subunit SRP68 n=1 Tax=Albugo laibachii Nc14 TaxID=890382 RepID=F0WFV5_9STRA|nr:signal recognition particle putative [Albugo laibachii Nc14]|eukprot:CCA20089.1 signal recognition particle putative [Albugo laibachii Nc14]
MENITMSSADAEGTQQYSIPILETIKSAQMQNGLRHRDYQRYRQYCARRLRRIRKSTDFLHGKGKSYLKRPIEPEIVTDVRHLYIALYNTERAWGYAMQLKEDDTLEKTKYGENASSRIKFHLTGRLRKAAEWSQRLESVCAVKADARTSLEAEAYKCYMTGIYAFYKEWHEEALRQLRTARRIYADLAKMGTISQQELFQASAEELDPFIRFCDHRLSLQQGNAIGFSDSKHTDSNEMSGSNALLQSKIEMVLLEARKQKAETLETVCWKGKKIHLQPQKISLVYLQTEEIIAQLHERKQGFEKNEEATYLRLFSCYDELMGSIKSVITAMQQQAKSGATLIHSDMESLQLLEEFVQYSKWTKQIDRSIALMKQLNLRNDKKQTQEPINLIHILDMLIQNVTDILKIPQLKEKEPVLYARYGAYECLFKAVRAAQHAQLYLRTKKYAEAMTLFQYASTLLDQHEDILQTHTSASDATLSEFAETTSKELIGAESRTIAQHFLTTWKVQEAIEKRLDKLSVVSDAEMKRFPSLVERQNEYNSGKPDRLYDLIRVPPELEAVPCKPLLFDIAHNELAFPDIIERTKLPEERRSENNSKSGSVGFLGWFRGS